MHLRREIVIAPGGTVAIDWMERSNPSAIAVFFPQAGNGTVREGGLVSLLMQVLHDHGLSCGFVVYRNMGGLPTTSLTLPGSAYCSTDDATFIFRAVRLAHPSLPVMVIAASLGSAVFTNWAARHRDEVKALRIGPALLLGFGHSVQATTRASDAYPLLHGVGGPPLSSLLINTWRDACDKDVVCRLCAEMGLDANQFYSARTFRAWDEMMAPIYGFSTAEEMYAQADVVNAFACYDVPSILVNSRDDILTPASRFHEQPMYDRPHLKFVATNQGGHLGWIESLPNATAPDAHAPWICALAREFAAAGIAWHLARSRRAEAKPSGEAK